MWKRIWFALVIAVVLTMALVGSIALAASTSAPSTAPDLSTAPPSSTDSAFVWDKYVFEGIPRPQWDSSVDGWFRYLGNGHFTSEFGREFFWRNGHFENADGSKMDLPPSAKAHLNSLGIYNQPTAQDMANWESMRATSPTQSGTAAGGMVPETWPGTYLDVGKMTTNAETHTGNAADISVADRSHGYQQYYGIGLRAYNGQNDYHCGLEFCNLNYPGSSTIWEPCMHAYIVLLNGTYDYEYAYPNSEFVTQGSTGVTKRLLLTLDSQGILEPWCQGQRMDYTNMVWGNQLAWAETAFEIGTDSKTAAPHDPANHHSSIMTQTNVGGSWLPQTESCSKFDKVEDQSGYQYPGVYNSNWTINANYNWMAHPL